MKTKKKTKQTKQQEAGGRQEGGSLLEPKVKADGELEVKLDGGTLVAPPHRVADGDVNLGAIEGAVTGVQLPFEARLDQGLLELLPNQTKPKQ